MIYLVDDDIEDIEIIQLALTEHSYKGPVRIVRDSRALMDILGLELDTAPNVILLDLNMPMKDGFQVLSEIKGHPEFRNIPVVILTASSNKFDETQCIKLGCDLYYSKPNNLKDYADIVNTIKKFVNKRT